MSLSPYYDDLDRDPVDDARALIREQRHLLHGVWALDCAAMVLRSDGRDLAREARDGCRRAYAVLCTTNAARRLLQAEIAAMRLSNVETV